MSFAQLPDSKQESIQIDEKHNFLIMNFNYSLEKSLEELKKQHNDLLVERSLTKLKVTQLNKMLQQEKRSLYDVEQHMLMIRTVITIVI
jgi:hypothetical protein